MHRRGVPAPRRSRRSAIRRSGTASRAGTESRSSAASAIRSRPAAGLPDDPDPSQSRYIEAAVCGILIGNLYAPNGNPWPGPKFDYKLAWLDRLHEHAQALLDSGLPAMLIGDFNVIPTDMDVYKPERWAKDALFAPEARAKFRELVGQGWTDAIRTLHPGRAHLHLLALLAEFVRSATPASASIMRCSVPSLAKKLKAAGVDRTPRGWDKTSDHAPMWVEVEV